MILTEEFISKQGSDNARAFFELATSLGYTILCSEDETGSLKRGFLLRNQYGAIYTCPPSETTLEVMTSILHFIIDFDRVGASTSAQPSQLNKMEQRAAMPEKATGQLCNAATDGSGTPQEAGVNLDELRTRAGAIGTYVQEQNGKIDYYRPRYKIPGTRYKFYFTVNNALDPARRQFRARYTFTFDELDELERWLAHDEEIFAECNKTYGVLTN